MVEYDQYTWIFAVSTIVSFACAFGIGANDVANSFASSVGAKALTIGQALLVAAVCEFSGAMGLGAGVTSTIRSGIANLNDFKDTPDLLMYGMMCVMIAAAFWDNLACHLELPVSTTHTTVGAIVGMAIATRGGGAVIWSQHQDGFPYLKGMTPVFLSWVVSPLASGICVLILFGFLRTFVLRSEHSFHRGLLVLPFFVTLTFFIIVVFIIQTGNKNKSWTKVGDGTAVWISFVCAVPLGLLTLFVLMPLLKKWVLEEEATMERAKEAEEGGVKAKGLHDVEAGNPNNSWFGKTVHYLFHGNPVGRAITQNRVMKTVFYGASFDIHEIVGEDEGTTAVWEHAEVFDYKTERLFRYLQVFTAMVVSFAHGSNDVANAVGPYAAVYAIWNTGEVPKSSPVPQWIYAMGGAGIVLGLATYGYKIMRVLGVKVSKLTNSRGFCAEMSTAVVVLVASRYGLPVSTTQVITGAILAIGLFEGAKGVNWWIIYRTFAGWVLTLIIAGLVAGLLVSFGAFGPSKVGSDDILFITKSLKAETLKIIQQINATNYGATTFNNTLNSTVYSLYSNWTALNKTNAAYTHPRVIYNLELAAISAFNSTYA